MMVVGNRGARFDERLVIRALKRGNARLVIAGIRLGRGVPLPGRVARFANARGCARAQRRAGRLTARSRGSSSDGVPRRRGRAAVTSCR
jgi:hypothetical protein